MKRLADPVLVRGRQDANRLSKAQNRYRPEVKWICVEKPLPELDVRCQQMVWGWVDAQADQRYDDPPNGLRACKEITESVLCLGFPAVW